MSVPILTACAGFLLAVLWMDLMFDSQAGLRGPDADESVLASIGAYYHRATTTSQPRGSLIAVVMGILLICLFVEAVRGGQPVWLIAVSAALAAGPILLALLRTVPAAVRLGRRAGTGAEQSRLARSVYRDHLVCLAGISAFLILRLVVVIN
jgi:hypothetical protein